MTLNEIFSEIARHKVEASLYVNLSSLGPTFYIDLKRDVDGNMLRIRRESDESAESVVSTAWGAFTTFAGGQFSQPQLAAPAEWTPIDDNIPF